MNPRSTGILFLVALVVVGGVWWNENVRKGDAEEAEAEARELFPELEEPDVRWLALETSDAGAARLERQDGRWRLVEPVSFPTDGLAVDGLVAAIVETRSAGVIESPQSPEVYGLGAGATEVRFGTGDGEFAVRVGGKTPVGGNHYAARGDAETVYTIPSFRAAALRRTLDELREKRVLPFDKDGIERAELRWQGGGVVLAKEEGAWRVVEPLSDRADPEAVESLLSDLSYLRADDFVDDPPADPEVGLDRPVFEAKLTGAPAGEDASAPPPVFHLKVGSENEAGGQHPVRAREHSLYLVSTDRLRAFPRDVAAYRFKELANFEAEAAKGLEIAFHDPEAGAHVVLAERTEDGWASSPERLAPGKAARMVAELAKLRGVDIVADALGEAEQESLGLVPPRVRLRVRGVGEEGAEGPVLAEILLGEPDPDRGIVARSADGERIYRIAFELAEHLPLSAEALRNRFLSKEEPVEDAPAP